MYGSCEVVRNNSVLNSPEVKHYSELSELNDIGEKCKTLSERAMKSSIHCASSIGEMKTLLKSDFKSIIEILDTMNNDFILMSQDISIMTAHMTKLNAVLYEVQDMIKDKLKAYDEIFINFDKKLGEYGDIIKETNRKIISSENNSIPSARVVRPSQSIQKIVKPNMKKQT